MILLAGDIGATNTRLAVFSSEKGVYSPLYEKSVSNSGYSGFDEIAAQFKRSSGMEFDAACIGVAGPVRSGRASVTNLPWTIDADQLASAMKLKRVELLNDLKAIASAAPYLKTGDYEVIRPGEPEIEAPIAVIAPGTGLGQAFLTWNGQRYVAHESEGGHTDFAPMNPLESELLAYLWNRFEHVSYERICSGIGAPNIFAFLADTGRGKVSDELKEKLARADDPAPVIIGQALKDTDGESICARTLDIFISVLGSEAGNLALKVSASGGVYLGGGIPPRIIGPLRGGAFLSRFQAKGRMSRLLERTPVYVILHPNPALLGAACHGLMREPERPEA